MTDANEPNLLLLVGAPRSGTSWISKILDSHPKVFYLHEPDTVLRSSTLSAICERELAASQVTEARQYLNSLVGIRTLKSSGSLPIFRKSYRTWLSHWLRIATILALRAADAAGARHWARRLPIPDLVRRDEHPLTVLKSVSSRGRLGLFGQAMPSSRVVFILRHPCGQVASMLAGMRRGKFERKVPFDEILSCDEARDLGLTQEVFQKLSDAQQAAWHWAVLNQKAINDLRHFQQSLIIRYEDLCSNPMDESKNLLNFAGLAWNLQTERFLRGSTSVDSRSDYYGVVRNSVQAASKWRTDLPLSDQIAVMEIATKVPVGEYYAKDQPLVSAPHVRHE